MSRYLATEPLDQRRHLTEPFSSRPEARDLWLRAYAAQSGRPGATRTYVVADESGRVLGYHTLVTTEVRHEAAPRQVKSGMSRHFPIPVVLIARLAVDRKHRGRGLGRSLLLDALQRIDRASNDRPASVLAVRAVLAQAGDDRASQFYRRYGFEVSGLDPHTLMATMSDVRWVIGCDPEGDSLKASSEGLHGSARAGREHREG